MLTPRMSSGSQDVERQDLAAHGLEVFGGVGQVVFALGVAGADLVEGVPEARQLEDVAARVDLVDGAFLGRAVAFLDDAEEPAGGVAEDAAEAGGIGQDGRAEQAGAPGRAAGARAGRPAAGAGATARRRPGPARGPGSRPAAAGRPWRHGRCRAARSGSRRGCRARPGGTSRTWSAA